MCPLPELAKRIAGPEGKYGGLPLTRNDIVNLAEAYLKLLEENSTWKRIADTHARDLKQALEDLDEAKENYGAACVTVVLMHEAATGRKGEGPRRGVIEDVADVRAEMLRLREALQWYADGNHFFRNAYHEPRITDIGEHAKAALADQREEKPTGIPGEGLP
jgi:hypothetical protein